MQADYIVRVASCLLLGLIGVYILLKETIIEEEVEEIDNDEYGILEGYKSRRN
jgi:hypothetical protein